MAVDGRFLGMNLKTFALVVGIIGLVANGIYFIVCCVQLANVYQIDSHQLGELVNAYGGDGASAKAAVGTTKVILWVQIVLLVLGLICSGLLIVGSKQERHGLLLPWIIIAFITIALSIFAFFQGIYYLIRGHHQAHGNLVISVLINLLRIVVLGIFLRGVMMLYNELRRNKHNPNVRMTNQI